MEYIKNIQNFENKEINNCQFTFLECISKYIDINNYYKILNSLDNRDINNIYNLIYVYWTKMINENIVNIQNVCSPKKNNIYTNNELNNLFLNFINNNTDKISNIVKCIFIMNIISSNLI